jgi:ABC-2 type transport system permease protein
MLAFWTSRLDAINQGYFVIVLFFSGRLAPLDLFPQLVQRAADILPFRWMLAFPVELLLGRLTPRELLIGLGAQLFWLIAGYLFVHFIYRAGIRRYAAFGG